jgi:MipA family protein
MVGCAVLLAASVGSEAAATEDVPLWELGMGAGVVSFPAYRGSSTLENYVLPVPYFIYHGEFLKSDRHGVRGDFLDSDWIELSISGALSPPTRSNNVPIRAGMPDLKATGEIGPELDLTLWRSDNHERRVQLRIPVRGAFTLQSPPRSAGVVASPHLSLDVSDVAFLPHWNVGLLTGPIIGSRAQNSYFYTVLPAYAAAARPAYNAPGGYAGTQFIAALSRRFNDLWVGAFVRHDTLAHASFDESPLLVKKSFSAAGVGVSWIFATSTERVSIDAP